MRLLCIMLVAVMLGSCTGSNSHAGAPVPTPEAMAGRQLVYTVTVPSDLAYKSANPVYNKSGFMSTEEFLRPADGYLRSHRWAFLLCVSTYLAGEQPKEDTTVRQMMGYEGMGEADGFKLASDQLMALEKSLGRAAVTKLLQAQGYKAATKDLLDHYQISE